MGDRLPLRFPSVSPTAHRRHRPTTISDFERRLFELDAMRYASFMPCTTSTVYRMHEPAATSKFPPRLPVCAASVVHPPPITMHRLCKGVAAVREATADAITMPPSHVVYVEPGLSGVLYDAPLSETPVIEYIANKVDIHSPITTVHHPSHPVSDSLALHPLSKTPGPAVMCLDWCLCLCLAAVSVAVHPALPPLPPSLRRVSGFTSLHFTNTFTSSPVDLRTPSSPPASSIVAVITRLQLNDPCPRQSSEPVHSPT